MTKEKQTELCDWSSIVINLLSLTDNSLNSILKRASDQGLLRYSLDYRVFLMCILRDNILPLQNRIIALLLLFLETNTKSSLRSKCLPLLFEIIDNTKYGIERWICYHLMQNDLNRLVVSSYSPNKIVNDDHSILDVYPITEDIILFVEKSKQDYHKDKHISQDLFPFISLGLSISQLQPYPYELYNLSDYIHDYLQQYKSFFFSSPSFDRPAIDFPPVRDEYLFVPPQITSESFIYTPIEKPAFSHSLHTYNTAWQKSLTKEECEEVCSCPAVQKEFESFVLSERSNEKTKKLTALMENNLELCHGLIGRFLKENHRDCCERLLMESDISLYALDVGSFIVLQNGVSSDCLKLYIRKYIKAFCERPMDTLVKCFCFFILGCCKKKLIDESIIHDDLIDLKDKYPSQMELSYTIYSLFGKTQSLSCVCSINMFIK